MGICRLAWLDIEEGRLPVEDGLLSVDAINATSNLEQAEACPRRRDRLMASYSR